VIGPRWDDLTARVHGLAGHLLDERELEQLAGAADPVALANLLRQRGIAVPETGTPAGPTELELAVRRWAGAALGTIARWAGPRSAALPFVFAEEDRRSIRAMLRGARQRAPRDERLAGLIPTPDLPEKALEELATSATTARVVAHLLAWHHPFANDIEAVATPSEPDLLAVEAALSAAVARHALAAGRRTRDRRIRRFVTETIDLDNALTVVALTRESTDVTPRDFFVAGGDRLTITAFEEAIATHEIGAAGRRIAVALGDTPCAELWPRSLTTLVGLEEELLRCRLRGLTRATRLDPLGPLAVLRFALRLRLQVYDLRRAIWRVALAATVLPAGTAA